MNNPFRRTPRSRWERVADAVAGAPAARTTRRGLLAVGAVIAASAASAAVSVVREHQDDQ